MQDVGILYDLLADISEEINSVFTRQISALKKKIINRPIIFTCGLFNIDWTIALSIIAAITTYLTIITQFDK
ncbi:CLUMA_CG016717, isoform A [Clunio marinus]|nr:CLUMA_CG016717, isoform A [Clunio marinus]